MNPFCILVNVPFLKCMLNLCVYEPGNLTLKHSFTTFAIVIALPSLKQDDSDDLKFFFSCSLN